MFKKSSDSAPNPKPSSKGVPSVLGPTVTFRGGELSADEDLVIQGTVEGTIAHQSHNLIIGQTGRVKADVKALIITVEGTVEGDIQGDEAVIIKRTARVLGNVAAPRVSVEDGASFTGSVRTIGTQTEAKPVTALAGSAGVRARRAVGEDTAS